MRMGWILAALAGTAAAAMIGSAGAGPQASAKPANQCFYGHDWQGWHATPDSRAIYIRVNINDIWRLDFSSTCPRLNEPGVHLVTKTVNDLVCSPLDLDLKVSDNQGFATPCIVSGVTKLSEAEAKALPAKLKP